MPAVMKIGYSRNLPHPLGRENIFWKNKKGLWDFEKTMARPSGPPEGFGHRGLHGSGPHP
ncbi:uncharacterized protein LOC112494237 isoform X2 [Cephus cinctus]|uniref:Uncharacterized protein LOC112494237 isoform X2 n=1 Tax=Cephus cinctus TaxID=211228 RepID=A0AAJ7RFQ0_CEPCN|nr:uncharacterized protein LOC112494237 isoform X2 [Cephus cinctus]